MAMMKRASIFAFSLFIASVALSGCGVWRGSGDVSTDTGEGAIGKGPGLVTGKRGGIVIYQK